MRIFNGSIYISPRGNMDNNDVNAKGCRIYSFEEEQTKKENRTNLLLNLLFSRKSMISLLGILYVILLNVLVCNNNDCRGVQFSSTYSRNLNEVKLSDIEKKLMEAECCDSISKSNKEERLKVKLLLKNSFESEHENVFGQNADVFNDLLCDDMWKKFNLNLHDKFYIKNGKHEMDHLLNKELFKLSETSDNREKMINLWKENMGKEKKKYYQMNYDIYCYLEFLRKKHKVPRKYGSKQWDHCTKKIKETEQNAKDLLEDIFKKWLENEHLDKNEFIVLISGCRLLWRKLSDDMTKACKVYILKPFNDVYNEKKRLIKNGEDLSSINYEEYFKSGPFLNNYSTEKNKFPTLQALLEKYEASDEDSQKEVLVGKSFHPLLDGTTTSESNSLELDEEDDKEGHHDEEIKDMKLKSLSHNKDQNYDETYNEQYESYVKEIESNAEKLAEYKVEKEFQEVNKRFREVGKRIKLAEKNIKLNDSSSESEEDSDEEDDENEDDDEEDDDEEDNDEDDNDEDDNDEDDNDEDENDEDDNDEDDNDEDDDNDDDDDDDDDDDNE
ncbi:exported protein (PHISTb) [Plasmodium gaboni]|uniref:Exported protein (PHISTb) n=1 Tax=Plasmodium gaboni TaxID=647221 RepID=A0A151LTM1_9APIC|nr:exported protein (PHISTb) [Plasmodium gaboni]KYO02511.1 exported protein (PHISTb) [Plasmodium gaboni]